MGSTQISDSSQSLSQGASQQASALEEISSSMELLESQSGFNSESAKTANEQATEARQLPLGESQETKRAPLPEDGLISFDDDAFGEY
ncbi:MAG: hypothetical protein GY866_14500 [Proteobacteria bacterium]|nr:hypothetical protein [Pseudomonadota bacterium]